MPAPSLYQHPSRQKTSATRYIVPLLALILLAWLYVVLTQFLQLRASSSPDVVITTQNPLHSLRTSAPKVEVNHVHEVVDIPDEITDTELDDSYHIVFSTGCSEFQDWQSIGVYSSAIAVGQRGIITRIASGCKPEQEEAIRHAMSHLPSNCRVHFAPNTEVRDHYNHVYKYANKPLGMMHWLTYADPPVPPSATVALCDPDFFFLRPLYHDSFDHPSKYFASGKAKKTPVPRRITKGTMVAQRYGIGGAPWRTGPGKNGQKAWGLKDYLTSIGRPDSPALAPDLNEQSSSAYYSFGAPYIALAEDWLPIATNWTNLMPMAVERNFGNLAEMYACSIAVADYGIRPAQLDMLMVSDVGAGGEGWPWVDKIPMDRACDPTVLTDPAYNLPFFLHYCQAYKINEFQQNSRGHDKDNHPNFLYSKYQVPNEILDCPAGSKAKEGGASIPRKSGGSGMHLGVDGYLPDPPHVVDAHGSVTEHRNIFSNCVATRATNQAARDYRHWFCEKSHD
jgi:hypothetical protein